ncbi:MAG TPA: prevent-host-death protein [Gammaproteobacteria bacterium]|jgi:antitoxin YefM|nr:prevent-host-death protein [Gammaproteobacteria bacterium]
MQAVNYSTFRKQLSESMDRVEQDHVPLLITRQNGTPAVLISLDEYNAFMETTHLASSAKNAERLNRAINELEAGKGIKHNLIEAD